MIDVLIVEDDPMVAQINTMYLNEIEGFNLIGSVSSVKKAIEFMEEVVVRLILLDIYMPEKDGLALLSYIRQNQIDIDVIIISAASDTKSIHIALQNGAIDYIIKPFQFERFKDALITYKNKRKVISAQDALDQKELDQLLDFQSNHKEITLPKGLTNHTLKQIWCYIYKNEINTFSTEDIVDGVGISRISIRKYLSFLEEINILTSHATYGGIGRPLTMFKVLDENKKNIEPYLKDRC